MSDERPCQDCGAVADGDSIVWFTTNPLWNRVMGSPDAPGVLCPTCFIHRSEAIGLRHSWTLIPESNQPDALSGEQVAALRWLLLKAIEAVSEERWCASWYSGIELFLHGDAGHWETIGRMIGWPVGRYEGFTWVSWDEAGKIFEAPGYL